MSDGRKDETASASIREARSAAKPSGFPIAAIGWIAAGCFVLISGCLLVSNFSLREEALSLRTDLSLTRVEFETLRGQLDADRILTTRQISDLEKARLGSGSTSSNQTRRLIEVYFT